MKNFMTTVQDVDVTNMVIKGGKYGCALLGLYCLYSLGMEAIHNGYVFNCSCDPDGKVSMNFTPPSVPVN